MNNAERFYFYKQNGLISHTTEEDRIKALVNGLLESLYIPYEDGPNEFKPDWVRISDMGIDETEPINWGDLSCTVEKTKGSFIVIIEEASPGDCSTLCDYVQKYLSNWGWVNCEIITEW